MIYVLFIFYNIGYSADRIPFIYSVPGSRPNNVFLKIVFSRINPGIELYHWKIGVL